MGVGCKFRPMLHCTPGRAKMCKRSHCTAETHCAPNNVQNVALHSAERTPPCTAHCMHQQQACICHGAKHVTLLTPAPPPPARAKHAQRIPVGEAPGAVPAHADTCRAATRRRPWAPCPAPPAPSAAKFSAGRALAQRAAHLAPQSGPPPAARGPQPPGIMWGLFSRVLLLGPGWGAQAGPSSPRAARSPPEVPVCGG